MAVCSLALCVVHIHAWHIRMIGQQRPMMGHPELVALQPKRPPACGDSGIAASKTPTRKRAPRPIASLGQEMKQRSTARHMHSHGRLRVIFSAHLMIRIAGANFCLRGILRNGAS